MFGFGKKEIPNHIVVGTDEELDKAFEGDAFQIDTSDIPPRLQDPDGVLKPTVDLLDSILRTEGEIIEVEKVIRDTEDRLEDSKKVFAQLVLETNNKLSDYRRVLEGLQANLEVLKGPQLAEPTEHREPFTSGQPKSVLLKEPKAPKSVKSDFRPARIVGQEESPGEREANHGQ